MSSLQQQTALDTEERIPWLSAVSTKVSLTYSRGLINLGKTSCFLIPEMVEALLPNGNLHTAWLECILDHLFLS